MVDVETVMKLALLLLPVAALTLAACGDDGPAPAADAGDPLPTAELEFDGRSFVTDGIADSPAPAQEVEISFLDGRVAARGGCNSMSGGYELDGDTLVVGPMAMTQMACAPELMELDTWLAELLGSGPTLTLEGDTLTIANDTTSVELVDREVARPDLPLEETRWVVEGVVANDAVTSYAATASLTITGDRVAVEAGCNRGAGSVTVGEGTLTFGPLALTKMMCDETSMELEAAVTGVLSGEVSYAIDSDQLVLTNAATGTELRLRADTAPQG
jgi:heat shock protein HslJ